MEIEGVQQARRLGISPPRLFGWRKAFLKKQNAAVPASTTPPITLMIGLRLDKRSVASQARQKIDIAITGRRHPPGYSVLPLRRSPRALLAGVGVDPVQTNGSPVIPGCAEFYGSSQFPGGGARMRNLIDAGIHHEMSVLRA